MRSYERSFSKNTSSVHVPMEGLIETNNVAGSDHGRGRDGNTLIWSLERQT
jgi:hypothetical protein